MPASQCNSVVDPLSGLPAECSHHCLGQRPHWSQAPTCLPKPWDFDSNSGFTTLDKLHAASGLQCLQMENHDQIVLGGHEQLGVVALGDHEEPWMEWGGEAASFSGFAGDQFIIADFSLEFEVLRGSSSHLSGKVGFWNPRHLAPQVPPT